MSYLLDTNVVSEFAKDEPHQLVIDWLGAHRDAGLYLSVITIGEIQQGISLLSSSQRKNRLTYWLNESLLPAYADWILPVDTNTMLQWGRLSAQLTHLGRKMPSMDAMIAATALEHNLSLVTRNVADFTSVSLTLINPWDR